MSEPRPSEPLLSVIMPAHQGAQYLPHSLAALRASDFPRDRWELIVVDDASSDETATVAAPYADVVVRLSGSPSGPAFARNRGAERARGRYLIFVDADVCAHTDALRRFAEAFEHQPELGAVFGSYDTAPAATGHTSAYRNLLHHYVHHRDAGHIAGAETFWTGLGAVSAELFARLGGFDANLYPRPKIEDIEFGYRIRALGVKIGIRPDIQGTHLKRWTLRGVIVTDVRDRGIPWMRLLLRKKGPATRGTLNLRASDKVYTAITGLGSAALLAGAVTRDWRWLLATTACVIIVLAGDWPLILWFGRQRGWWFAARTLPLRVLYYVLNVVSALVAILLHLGNGIASRIAPGSRIKSRRLMKPGSPR